MPESPRYPSIGTPQTVILDSDHTPVGYKVAVCFAKGDVHHIESVDVVVGKDAVIELSTGGMENFSTWVHSHVVEHNLVGKANIALDAL